MVILISGLYVVKDDKENENDYKSDIIVVGHNRIFIDPVRVAYMY